MFDALRSMQPLRDSSMSSEVDASSMHFQRERRSAEAASTTVVSGGFAYRDIGSCSFEAAFPEVPRHLKQCVVFLYGYQERGQMPVQWNDYPSSMVPVVIECESQTRLQLAGERKTIGDGIVVGPNSKAIRSEHDGFQSGIIMALTPLGARMVFGRPMSELSEQVVPLADLLHPAHRHLSLRIFESASWTERFRLVFEWLERSLLRASVDTRLVEWTLKKMQTQSEQSITDLALQSGYSQKHLIAKFRDQIGVAPKLYSRTLRFEAVTQSLRDKRLESWSQMASRVGYCDQAHLAREVREFSGFSPEVLKADLRSLADLQEVTGNWTFAHERTRRMGG